MKKNWMITKLDANYIRSSSGMVKLRILRSKSFMRCSLLLEKLHESLSRNLSTHNPQLSTRTTPYSMNRYLHRVNPEKYAPLLAA